MLTLMIYVVDCCFYWWLAWCIIC